MTPRVLRDPECVLGAGLSFVFGFVTTGMLIAGVVLAGRRLLR